VNRVEPLLISSCTGAPAHRHPLARQSRPASCRGCFDGRKRLWDTSSDVFMALRCAIAVTSSRRFCGLVCFFCCLLTSASAQRAGLNDPNSLRGNSIAYDSDGGAVIVVTVFTESSKVRLDRQSVVRLLNKRTQTAVWETTTDRSEAVFGSVQYGGYEIEVSAVGFLTANSELEVGSSQGPFEINVVLERDPAAVNLNVADDAMPSRARKNTRRAVAALRSGNLKAAQKRLGEAYKLVPTSAELNFLLGYLYFLEKDFEQASTYLDYATSLNPRHLQALALLGRLELERGDFRTASSALEQAVAVDAEYWLLHDLLAEAYLKQQNYEKARDEAQLAIQKGNKQATPAQLVLGQALLNLQRDQEGLLALKTYLEDSPGSPMAPKVRDLIDEIEKRNPARSSDTENKQESTTASEGVDPLLALGEPTLAMKGWQPPGIDDTELSVASRINCPYEKVIDGSGERVKELVDDVARFSAIEELLHQRLNSLGDPTRTETRKFNYVASISETDPGLLLVDEYRAEHLSPAGFPDQIATNGFAVLALVFHPRMRDAFEMKCEGLGDWHGQATWLVRFEQRDDRPNHIHAYKVGGAVYPVGLKGRAWITADNFQIVRIEAELVKPAPQIQLLAEHQIVEYGPIPFQKKNTVLWLPKSAEIYFDFRKHRFYRRHSFNHYMLFSVDTDEKRKEPKASHTENIPAPNT
jgi:tetratricopeptide (TPR) repeat protein